MYKRRIDLSIYDDYSFFLWGARQTGKSTLLKTLYPNALYIDLLLSQEYKRYLDYPEQFRERCIGGHNGQPVIVDEVQRLPDLLNEVHWLIENYKIRFILSGSSPRKILRKQVNLLGGRALRLELYPLTSSEIPDFDVLRASNHGLLPRMYDADRAHLLIEAYIGSYLEDEIIAETKIRNAGVFSRYLSQAAFANGEVVNYTNIAQDCGVASSTIKEYYQILCDTLIGSYVPAYQKSPKRRIIASPKFYFFDVGITNFLLKRSDLTWGSVDFGHSFEHLIFMELKAYSQYSGKKFPIYYWRTSSQIEVDFILGDAECVIEVKSTNNVLVKHMKGIKAFANDYEVANKIIVSNDPFVRMSGDITIYPWKIFLERLWANEII